MDTKVKLAAARLIHEQLRTTPSFVRRDMTVVATYALEAQAALAQTAAERDAARREVERLRAALEHIVQIADRGARADLIGVFAHETLAQVAAEFEGY